MDLWRYIKLIIFFFWKCLFKPIRPKVPKKVLSLKRFIIIELSNSRNKESLFFPNLQILLLKFTLSIRIFVYSIIFFKYFNLEILSYFCFSSVIIIKDIVHTMLLLNEENISKIVEDHLSEITNTIEEAIINAENDKYIIPIRMHISQAENTHLIMPVYSEKFYSTKLVSVFPNNTKKNVPVINGMISLNSSRTGEALALLNGATVTGYRTGAVGAVGLRYLTSEDVDTLGVVGAGVQGYHQVIAASKERDFKKILIYDIDNTKAIALQQKLIYILKSDIIDISENIENFVQQCDVIITATTSPVPVLPDDKNLLAGKTIIAIGSFTPQMKELPNALFHHIDKCYVDTKIAIKESGDLINPLNEHLLKEDDILLLGEAIQHKIKLKENQSYLFKSVGMALFDLYAASKIYEIALKEGIGLNYNL